jgi:hypothetical protein
LLLRFKPHTLAAERIIVFRTFDSLIDANIIKTKLDAYGIPCYLTGEHVTHLTTPLLSGGIQLHIFEQDKDRVEELVQHELTISDDLISCPKCHSKRILSATKEPGPGRVVHFLLQLSKRHYCLDCETEFDN